MSNETAFSMSLSEVAEIVGGQLHGADCTLHGISTDTRKITGGELFVALKGAQFDGHDFITQAISQGAAGCVSQHVVEGVACVVVKDTLQALGQLAKAWRLRFDIPVFAITGSNGKTTVKEMIASIAQQKQHALVTQGNLNNDIGVPLTLFRMDARHEVAVIEMGANHHGEISYLVNLAQPNICVLTNAGSAHLEGFGSLEGVARAKGEIFENLPDKGFAIINQDDQFAELWKAIAAGHHVLTFGLKNQADVTAEWQITINGSELSVTTPIGEFDVHLKLLGRHNILNALAATAAGIAAGYSLEQIQQGLQQMRPVKGRLQLKRGLNDSRVIDDTYNANPTSLQAALSVLNDFPGRRLMALGDMGELGSDTKALHTDAGNFAKQLGIDSLYAYGDLAACAAQGFGDNAHSYREKSEMINALRDTLAADVTLLVKGSRAMHMEQVVEALTVAEG